MSAQISSKCMLFVLKLCILKTLSNAIEMPTIKSTNVTPLIIKNRANCVNLKTMNSICECGFQNAIVRISCLKEKIIGYFNNSQPLAASFECQRSMTDDEYARMPSFYFGVVNDGMVHIDACPIDILELFHMQNITKLIYVSKPDLNLLHTVTDNEIGEVGLTFRNLSPLTADYFKKFLNLFWLEFTTDKLELPVDLFAPLEKLTYLKLHDDKLFALPERIFSSQNELRHLNLSAKVLRNLPSEIFHKDLVNLWQLALYSNEIKSLDWRIFKNLEQLEVLIVHWKCIQDLPPGIFNFTTNLRKLELVSPTLNTHSLPPRWLINLPKLQRLHINCYLFRLAFDTFSNLTEILELNLSYNNLITLSENIFHDQINLRWLDLSQNFFTDLPAGIFAKNIKLNILELSGNGFKTFDGAILEPLTALEEFYINGNELEYIEIETFATLHKLKVLELYENYIKQIAWANLPNSLKMLNLRANRIASIDFGKLANSTRGNKLVVNMSKNNISEFLCDTANLNLNKTRSAQAASINVDLRDNPIMCDCELSRCLHVLRGENPTRAIKIKANEIFCAAPLHLKGKSIQELSHAELLCALTPEHCAENCNCWLRKHDETLIIDCAYGKLTELPNLPRQNGYTAIELNMTSNNLRNLSVFQKLHGKDDVENNLAIIAKLWLSGNEIENFQINHLPQKLTHLDLSNNKLTTLDEAAIGVLKRNPKLKFLQLAGNPWQCDCKAQVLLEFLQNPVFNRMLNDSNDMQCDTPNKGAQMQHLNISQICAAEQSNLSVWLASAASIVVFLLILVLLYMRYNLEIKIWLYGRRLCLWFVADAADQQMDELHKKYDAFISYSSKDEQFVAEHLVPQLEEGTPNFKICVHYRDFRVGDDICTNIENAVANSRRTIVVLSKNFLESAWARQEFRAAHLAALEERKPKVILVLYGQIDNIDDIDPALKVYLKTKTYLTYDDPLFWQRLRFAMPHTSLMDANKQDI